MAHVQQTLRDYAGEYCYIVNQKSSMVSTETSRNAINTIMGQQATFKNSSRDTRDGKGVVMGFTHDTKTGEWNIAAPAGMPPDFLGRATHSMNLTRQKFATQDRLRAKLEAKRKAK
jgi:hypothetical protein